jgi:hypothetical protein
MMKRIMAIIGIGRSDQPRWIERDGPRLVLAAIMLVFVIATSLSDGKLLPDFSARQAPAVSSGTSADSIRTGSILVTSADGNTCEYREIDNSTWRIRSVGRVACDDAVKRQAERNGNYTPQTRLEAIRDGFYSKR